MRFKMAQKIFCLGDDYAIEDEGGREAFYVDGKVFTLRKTLSLLDPQGREAARIVKRLLSFGPAYDVYRDGRQVATVKKQLFTLFRCKFTIDVPGPDDYEAVGSFIDHDYRFERGGRTVAWVSKKWFRLTDTYGVEVADGGAPERARAGLAGRPQSDSADEGSFREAGERSRRTHHTDGEDAALILASAVVIDLCCHEDEQRDHD